MTQVTKKIKSALIFLPLGNNFCVKKLLVKVVGLHYFLAPYPPSVLALVTD